jgi:hypothetical protein
MANNKSVFKTKPIVIKNPTRYTVDWLFKRKEKAEEKEIKAAIKYLDELMK